MYPKGGRLGIILCEMMDGTFDVVDLDLHLQVAWALSYFGVRWVYRSNLSCPGGYPR